MGRAAVLNASLLLGMRALAQVGWEALLGAPTAPRPPHASVCLDVAVELLLNGTRGRMQYNVYPL